jgi:hypothetical protein
MGFRKCLLLILLQYIVLPCRNISIASVIRIARVPLYTGLSYCQSHGDVQVMPIAV